MKKLIFLFVLSLLASNVFSSHYIGGEITWECNKDPLSFDYGKYTFYLTIYQDCDGIDFSTVGYDITVHNHPSLFSINLPYFSSVDISPTGVAGTTPCYDCNTQPINTFGAVKQWNYVSAPIVITGTPPADGWHFTWGTCCRSENIVNIPNPGFEDWTVRSVMYPYTDPNGIILPNGNTCYENSPIFKEEPKTILCTGYPFSYSHLAFDVELDSLSYSWAEPLDVAATYNAANPSASALTYSPPYNVNSPIPGNPTLNNENGEISFLSNIAGLFVTVVKVEAFKCGQLVAEVYRDVNVGLLACGALPNGSQNSPPVITSPVGPQNWITTLNPSTGLPSYETTVMAGELVSFSVVATDNDINATGNMQDVFLEVEGGQLDPQLALSNIATFNVTSSSPGTVSGDFLWQSNCEHMQDFGCGRQGGAYTFNLKAYDDFCPANGIVIATITINVIPPQPDLRCLAVDESGGVDLFYSFPDGVVDTNIKYDIYFSKQYGGPYQLIDSIFYPSNQYYHPASNAQNSKSYYFLLGTVTCGVVGSGSDSLLYSDTLSTIYMNSSVTNSGLSVDLSWNPIHDPLLTSSALDYDLHYIDINNLDNIITSLPDLFYQFNTEYCNYNPEFYVEISDVSGCVSKSSIASVNLLDTLSPNIPVITDVSVDNLGKSTVTWEQSSGSDFYIIYFLDSDGAWITLDSVLHPVNTYTFASSQAVSNVESFSILAIDSCGNSKNRTSTHNSILLQNTSDACDYSILLNWNDYINWQGGVSYYSVIVTETDSIGNSNDMSFIVNGVTEFLFENVSSSNNYSCFIEAFNIDSSYKAVSNIININLDVANKPLFNYIESVSVNHFDGSVDLSCIVDLSAVIERYDIYRSIEQMNNFSKIGDVNFSGSSPIQFNDNSAETDDYFYQYKVFPVDTCGQLLIPPVYNSPTYSNDTSIAQTIFLDVKTNLDYSGFASLDGEYTNTIFFNNYKEWIGDVSKYYLYRSVNREPFNLVPLHIWDIENNPNEELKYVDVVTSFGDGNGRFCYYIQAIEGDNTPYGPVTEGSFSNIACISQTPILFVPSVFTPNGDEHNEIFIPVTYFVSNIGYSFSIYSRGGEEIFFTNDPEKGWDGTFKNISVQDGNYVYLIKYLNGVGSLVEKSGVISLIR
tara:strand:+ start:1849 stop:5277 length:3429 start_codon:yes stop_codon:yes gene_type:complete